MERPAERAAGEGEVRGRELSRGVIVRERPADRGDGEGEMRGRKLP